MTILLIRLVGPMQSWGTQSRFSERDTGREPSKSGVIGLICAALGRKRSESIQDLGQLRMGVRVDQEGKIVRDYQTTSNIFRASGGLKPTNVSNRYYLADASFLVALEGPEPLLSDIDSALRNPRWQIYLGRKSFLPSMPVWVQDGLLEATTVEEVFQSQPCYRTCRLAESEIDRTRNKIRLRCVIDAEYGLHDAVRVDVPLSFESREFLPRYVTNSFVYLDTSLAKEVPLCFYLD